MHVLSLFISVSFMDRHGKKAACKKLADCRAMLGPEPIPTSKKKEWDKYHLQFNETIKKLNKKIADFNIVAPSPYQHMFHINADKEVNKILTTYNEKVAKGEITVDLGEEESAQTTEAIPETYWSQTWKSWTRIFKNSRDK